MKKTLSIILSIVMLFSITGGMLSAYADDVDYTNLTGNGTWYEGYISDYNTEDYYKVVLTSDGTLSIKLMHYMKIDFYLFNKDFSNCIDSEYPGGGSASSPVTDTYTYDLSKGTYYIKISKSFNNTGKYKISKSFTSFGNNEIEPNDYETAMDLSEGNIITGALTIQDDVDWYKINIKTNVQISIKLTQYMKTDIYLFNNDLSNCIGSEYPGGGTASSPVTNTYTYDLSKGTYYIKISKSFSYTGKYKLSWKMNINVPTPSNFRVSTRNTTSLKLSWSKIANISGYQLQRKSGSSYKTITNTTATSATVSKLSSATAYKFRVRAYKTVNGKKYYGSWKNLTTATKPGKVSIKAPSTNKKHQIIAKWSTVARASGYQVQYCKNKSCSNVIATKTVSGQSKTSYTGNNFTKGKTYYVRVRAYKTVDGTKYYGDWSGVKSIKSK